MLIVILCHDNNKDIIIVRAYNSLFQNAWQNDPTTLKVMANVVEHILVDRGVPGTCGCLCLLYILENMSPAHTCLPHMFPAERQTCCGSFGTGVSPTLPFGFRHSPGNVHN